MAWRQAYAGSSGSAVGVWEIEPERCTKPGNVVTVDVSDWIAGVPAHSPLRSFAADRCASDAPLTLESSGREDVCVGHAAVVDRPIGQWLVEVKINPPAGTVVQDEIPRSVVALRQNPVDTMCGEDHDELCELFGRQPQIEVRVVARLVAEQGIHTPASADTGVSSLCLERLDEVDD